MDVGVDPDRDAGVPRLPREHGHQAGVGLRGAALFGDVGGLLGYGRPAGPGRHGHLGGHAALRQLHPGQPAARGRADDPHRAVALPAEQPPVREPAVHQARVDPGVRLPEASGAAAGAVAEAASEAAAGDVRPHRPQRHLDGQGRGVAHRVRLRPLSGARHGLRRLQAPRGASARPVRDLVRAGQRSGDELARMADGVPASVVARGGGVRRRACRRHRVLLVDAVGRRQPAALRAEQREGRRHAHRRDDRPRGRRQPGERRSLDAG